MNQIPAGWYDDPEDANRWRYWDGSAWTEHRSAKGTVAPDSSHGSVWSIIPATFSLVKKHWRELTLVGIPIAVVSLLGLIALYRGFDISLSPDLSEIFERVSEPGFNPYDKGEDEAYIRAIDISMSATALFWWSIAAAALTVAWILFPIALARFLGAAHAGGSPGPATAYRAAAARAPRVLGWVILSTLALVSILVIVLILAVITPITLLLTIPGAIAGWVWLVPYATVFSFVLMVGPTDVSPVVATQRAVKGNWGRVWRQILVMFILSMGVGLGTGLITSPVSAASAWGGIVLSVVVQIAQLVIGYAGSIMIYSSVEGPLDPALTAPPDGPFSE